MTQINKFMHDQVKKEVISQLLGKHLGSHVQGDSLYFFKPDYYEKTLDPEKKGLIRKIILEILSTKSLLPQKRLRAFAAYVAADIGMTEAKPCIEKIAVEKSIQNSHYHRIFEMALEKLK